MAYKIWTGGAPAVAKVVTITVGGTWATNDLPTIAIGGKSLIVTAGTAVATTDITAELSASFNASSATSPTPAAGYARNAGGQSIYEFQQVTASYSGSVVTLTGEPGVDFTVTVADNSTSGTLTLATVVAATGPNDFANPENYLGGSLLTDGDTLVCDRGSYDILWNLGYYRTNTIGFTLIRTTDYRGTIGHAPFYSFVNGDDETVSHPAYWTRRLQIYSAAAAHSVQVIRGLQTSIGAGATYLDAAGQSLSILSVASGSLTNSASSVLDIVGGDWGRINVQSGNIKLESEGELAANYMSPQTHLLIGGAGDSDDLLTVDIGANFDFTTVPTVLCRSGSVTCRSPVTVVDVNTDRWRVLGGTWAQNLTVTSSNREVQVDTTGTLEINNRYSGSSIHIMSGATLDAERSAPITLSGGLYLYKDATVNCTNDALDGANACYVGCSQRDIKGSWTPNVVSAQSTAPAAIIS